MESIGWGPFLRGSLGVLDEGFLSHSHEFKIPTGPNYTVVKVDGATPKRWLSKGL